jgi:hypothetical protein
MALAIFYLSAISVSRTSSVSLRASFDKRWVYFGLVDSLGEVLDEFGFVGGHLLALMDFAHLLVFFGGALVVGLWGVGLGLLGLLRVGRECLFGFVRHGKFY